MSSGAAGRHPGLARSRHQQHPVPAAVSRQHLNSCAPGRRGTGTGLSPSLARGCRTPCAGVPARPARRWPSPSFLGACQDTRPGTSRAQCAALGSPPFPSTGRAPQPCSSQNSPPQVRVRWPPLPSTGISHSWLGPELESGELESGEGPEASPHGMLFPTVLLWGVCRDPPAPRRTLCDKSRWCRAVPAVGAAPARPCPCQSPGEAVPASAALTQLNPAQQHEMETRHPECQLWSKGKAGFRSLGVSFGPLSYSSSQPTLCHTRGTTALGSGRPWG